RCDSKNAKGIDDQHIHARGFDGVVFAVSREEVVLLLQNGVEFLPGLEDFERTVKSRANPRFRKIVAEDRLEGRIAGDSEVAVADLENLAVVDDVIGGFLARAPLRHGVRGDSGIAVLSYDRYRSHVAPAPPRLDRGKNIPTCWRRQSLTSTRHPRIKRCAAPPAI